MKDVLNNLSFGTTVISNFGIICFIIIAGMCTYYVITAIYLKTADMLYKENNTSIHTPMGFNHLKYEDIFSYSLHDVPCEELVKYLQRDDVICK